jgi:hypothetical protein
MEVKNIQANTLPAPKNGFGKAKYPFATCKVGQYFDIPVVGGRPKLATIKSLCYVYKDAFEGKFKYAAMEDENRNPIIRVWSVAREG